MTVKELKTIFFFFAVMKSLLVIRFKLESNIIVCSFYLFSRGSNISPLNICLKCTRVSQKICNILVDDSLW